MFSIPDKKREKHKCAAIILLLITSLFCQPSLAKQLISDHSPFNEIEIRAFLEENGWKEASKDDFYWLGDNTYLSYIKDDFGFSLFDVDYSLYDEQVLLGEYAEAMRYTMTMDPFNVEIFSIGRVDINSVEAESFEAIIDKNNILSPKLKKNLGKETKFLIVGVPWEEHVYVALWTGPSATFDAEREKGGKLADLVDVIEIDLPREETPPIQKDEEGEQTPQAPKEDSKESEQRITEVEDQLKDQLIKVLYENIELEGKLREYEQQIKDLEEKYEEQIKELQDKLEEYEEQNEEKEGDSGYDVERLQEALQSRGLYNGPIDGQSTSEVTTAVREFQEQEGLLVDGIAGSATLKALGILN